MAKKKNPEWQNCSEAELASQISSWLKEQGDLHDSILFVNGEMGAGKSTFARFMLAELAPGQWSKGSPTFPLVHEYRSSRSTIYHIDLYRLKSARELEESGILSQIEEPGAIALVEWASQFPEVFEYWTTGRSKKRVWNIDIRATADPERRDVRMREA